MDKNFRLYIGTLKTIEQEFDSCVKAINNQTYKNFKHFIFNNLPNKIAHYTLITDFLNKKDEFDILIKIDADVVLTNNSIFEEVVNLFKRYSKIKHIQFKLWDFFTLQKIWGLNAYRNNISISKQDKLFVDRFIKVEENEVLFLDNVVVGYHSPNPSDYQAFHFGIHRQLKKQYFNIIIPLYKAYFKTFNRKRALALIGAKLARHGMFDIDDLKVYNNPKIWKALYKYQKKHGILLFFLVLYSFITLLVEKIPKFVFLKLKKIFNV